MTINATTVAELPGNLRVFDQATIRVLAVDPAGVCSGDYEPLTVKTVDKVRKKAGPFLSS